MPLGQELSELSYLSGGGGNSVERGDAKRHRRDFCGVSRVHSFSTSKLTLTIKYLGTRIEDAFKMLARIILHEVITRRRGGALAPASRRQYYMK